MVTVLTKSNIYLGKSLFGIANKVTAPDIEMETATITHGFGSYDVNTAFKSMTSNINIQGFDKDVFNAISNPFGWLNFTIYGALEEYSNESLVGSEQAKLIIRASSKKFSLLGELEQQKNLDYPIDFNVSAAKLYINNKEKYVIDNINQIYRINGVDLLAKVRIDLALQ